TGWARAGTARRADVRRTGPRVQVPPGDHGGAYAAARQRLPPGALELVRSALAKGPVLVQVPRSGYAPALACVRCRTPARGVHCAGPLALSESDSVPHCRWCGRPASDRRCPECGATGYRAPVIGAARTAEE